MIHEFFGSSEIIDKKETAVMLPKRLYKQERDWTCSIACMRSIVSSIKDLGSEESIIQKYKLSPGPYYSKDIKKLNILRGTM